MEKEELNLPQERFKRPTVNNRRTSESDTDSEIQNSFTTIELNPADITVHHTPVPEAVANDDEDDEAADEDDVYRKAASLGDLSKYENKASTTLERAQSLDMTDTGSKKRKAPMPPPDDIHESTEDLTKLDQIEVFDRRKLKKSSKWGNLEDAIWSGGPGDDDPLDDRAQKSRKKSNSSNGSTLERSKSNVEMQVTKDEADQELSMEPANVSDGAIETSIELYNLPLSKQLTQDFIKAERLFDPEADNALARLVNDGEVVKSPTPEQLDVEFRKAHPLPESDDDLEEKFDEDEEKSPEVEDTFEKAIEYFDTHTKNSLLSSDTKINLSDPPEELYAGKQEVKEEPMTKVTLNFSCPGCDHEDGRHHHTCEKKKTKEGELSYHQTIRVEDFKSDANKVKEPTPNEKSSTEVFETHFAKPIINILEPKSSEIADDEDEATYEFGSVTVNSKNLSPSPDKHNVSNVSVSSGENSEDSELLRESVSMEFRNNNESSVKSAPPLPNSPMPSTVSAAAAPQKMTYVTEIKVSPTNREEPSSDDVDDNALSDNEEIVSILESSSKKLPEAAAATTSASSSVMLNVTSNGKLPAGKKPPVPPRRSDATRFVPRPESSTASEKQVVYVSEYKSPAKEDKVAAGESGSAGSGGKKFENWIFLKDSGKERQHQEINPWGNGSSQSQPVTSIVLSSSGDEKILRK